MTRSRKAMVLMVLFATAWAAVELIGAAEFTRVPATQIIWTRYAVHLGFMLLLFGWKSPASLVRTRRLPLQLGRSMLMVAMPAAWILGQRFGIPYGEFMPVFWVTPLLVMALASVVLKERVPTLYWIAGLLASLGAALQFDPAMPTRLWHLVFPLAMAASFSLYLVLTRALRDEPTKVSLFYTAFGVFAVLSPLMPRVWVWPSLGDMVLLGSVGLVGYMCLYFLDRVVHVSAISIVAPLLAVQALSETAVSQLLTHHLSGTTLMLGFLAVAVAAAGVWFAPATRADTYSTQDSSRGGEPASAGFAVGAASPWRRLFR